jgi:aminotransferase
VFTRDELAYIASLAEEFDTWVITDEVYEHIVYEGSEHVYFAALPGMAARTISCSSLSKTYSITGWRLGYTIAPEAATAVIRKVHDFLTVGAAAPLQEAAVAGLPYTRPQGAYYVLVDIGQFDGSNDTRFCEWLAAEGGVAAVPGSSFFREKVTNLIRFHFAKKEETLAEAGSRLKNLRRAWRERGYA